MTENETKKTGAADSNAKKSNAGNELGERAQREIGKQLRALFDEVVNEPLPDRFTELLEQLEHDDPPAREEPRKDSGDTRGRS